MEVDHSLIDKYLSGATSPEETVAVLAAVAVDPELEEYAVSQMRLDYEEDRLNEYDSFIPAGSMAADGDSNLCDFQCELFILRREGETVDGEEAMQVSRRNYWLRTLGTPLYNMGRLLESRGFLVSRIYGADLGRIEECLADKAVIAVVNGDVLEPGRGDGADKGFDDAPNHAVVVLSVDGDNVTLYNPACAEEETVYPTDRFLNAWRESGNYMVTARRKSFPQEYEPQPVDLSGISLDPDLKELTEMIAEHVHDIWAVKRFKEGYTYGPVRDDEKKHNPDLVPYSMLPEGEKEYDREMAVNAIKLVKRLGYRLVNVNRMYKCPHCGEVIEPDFCYCPACGKELGWEAFR